MYRLDTAYDNVHGLFWKEWFISVCQKVEYLFPESHSIAYAILMIRLVRYVLHYPDVTDSLMIETAMKLLQEWL